MKKKISVIAVLLVFVFSASGYKKAYRLVYPGSWPKPTYNFSENPLSEAKIELGRVLFYDPLLSRDTTISCASCHSPYNAFTHVDHRLSHGINDRIGTRNSPALMNLAWSNLLMWDGAVNHIDVQALAPIENPDEMDESFSHVLTKLRNSNLYPELFMQAYGDTAITGEKTLKAVSAFMLTLISANSKYDQVKRGEAEFTTQEQHGYRLFLQYCVSCHAEPLFTNNSFANNGLPADTMLNDYGRMRVTLDVNDSLLFKVPTLRNIEFTYPYMHDGRFKKLSDVLKHYTSGIQHSSTLSKELQQKITLSANEKVDLTAFLLTLTDKEFMFNPKFGFPKEIFFNPAKDN